MVKTGHFLFVVCYLVSLYVCDCLISFNLFLLFIFNILQFFFNVYVCPHVPWWVGVQGQLAEANSLLLSCRFRGPN